MLYDEFRSVEEKVEINKNKKSRNKKKGDFFLSYIWNIISQDYRTKQRNAQDFIKNSLQLIRHQPEQNLKLSDVERM